MGLTNGASGTIRDIIYPLNRTADSLPSTILIEFTDYIGPKFSQQIHPKKIGFQLTHFQLILKY